MEGSLRTSALTTLFNVHATVRVLTCFGPLLNCCVCQSTPNSKSLCTSTPLARQCRLRNNAIPCGRNRALFGFTISRILPRSLSTIALSRCGSIHQDATVFQPLQHPVCLNGVSPHCQTQWNQHAKEYERKTRAQWCQSWMKKW